MPTTTHNRNVSPQELQALEAPLVALTQQCGGDLRKVLFAFFGFLHRRTDFYMVPPEDSPSKMGFRQGDAEKVLLAAFRQFPLRKIPKEAAAVEPKKETTPTAKPVPKGTSSTAEGRVTAENEGPPTIDESPIRYTEEGLQVPVGNGGTTKRYKWTQTLDETSVLINVKGLKAKELDVSIKTNSVSIKSKSPMEGSDDVHAFVDGSLTHKIVPAESTWTLEGGILVLVLYKSDKTFWKTVIEGDEEIDTDQVDSRRKIDQYDESTQGLLRKMIFDQNQERRGLPKSDEILGKKTVPPLPMGVEYIDQDTLKTIPSSNTKE